MKWNDYFKIVEVEGERETNDWWAPLTYNIVDPDDRVVGSYKDFKYAKKQAKYKFKKLQAKLEKILLA